MKNYIRLLIFLISIISKSQTIKGTVTDENGTPISSVTVLLKENDNILAFNISKNDGYFELDIINDSSYLEIKKLGYESDFIYINELDLKKEHVFILYKSLELKEVFIKNNSAFINRNDTVFYNVNKYKNSADRNIEDVLKKLPGITVEDNGIIKYKNKPIEKLLLDGDDLFGSQYTNGSRNISPDMIEQVQALENFEENYLLKGIKYSDNVALNLKLKKGIADISGNSEIGYGITDRYEGNVNGIIVSNILKNFTTLSYNNTGLNTTPFDYFSGNSDVSSVNIKNELASTAIDESKYYSSVGVQRANLNNYLYGNTNSILKLSKSASLRFNFTYLNDIIRFNTDSYSNFFVGNSENLEIFEQTNSKKRPELYDLNIKLTLKNQKSLFENELFLRKEKTLSELLVFSNYRGDFNTLLNTKNKYIKNHSLWTKSLNPKQTIQFHSVFSYNDKPQGLYVEPGIDLLRNESYISNTYQWSNFEKYYSSIGFNLFGKSKIGKYELNASQDFIINNLKSSISQDGIELLNDFENKLNYELLVGNIEGKNSFSIGKFIWTNQMKIKNYWLKNNNESDSHTVYSPLTSLTYKVNEENKFDFSFLYNEIPPQEQNMYNKYILTNYRTLKNNIASFDFLKSKELRVNFSKIDGYHQFTWIMNLNYQSSINNIFNIVEVENNLTKIKSYILNERNDLIGVNTSLEKYYYPIRSNLKLQLTYNWMNYKNIVNNSDLRTNINESFNVNFKYKSLFNFFINLENEMFYNYRQIRTKGTNNFYNLSSFQNSIKLLIKPSKSTFINLTWDYYKPSTNNRLNYNFIDLFLKQKIFKGKYELYIKGQNLLNINKFKTISLSDYSESYASYSLNNRFILLGVNFQF